MSPAVKIRPTRPSPSWLTRSVIGHTVMVVLVAGSLIAVGARVFDDPAVIERVQIENSSEYDIRVAVAAADGDGILPLGVASQHCSTQFHAVTDQGGTWVIAYRAQGLDGGSHTLSREQLIRDAWQVRIPDEVIAQLRNAGAPASPALSCPAD